MGFEGFVVSDWHGTESTVGAATGDLDLEMPGVPDVSRGGLFGEPLAEAIESGAVPGTRLDDMVERVLGTMERFGLLDDTARDAGAVDTPAHRALAERIAVRGTVLLENDGVLPLSEGTDVALIGPHVHEATVGGGGSSEITPLHRTSPREGIEARAGGSVTVTRRVTETESVSLFEELPFDFGDEDEPRDETGPAPTVSEAVTAAAGRADVSVVFVRDAATRGPGPREPRTARRAGRTGRRGGGCRRPDGRRRLQRARRAPGARRGARSVVPRSGGRPGHRLGPLRRRGPVGTVARHLRPRSGLPDDRPATVSRCRRRGTLRGGPLVGYRRFDATGTEPTYPFGHGESYATFGYGAATTVNERTVRVSVENVGARAGREVIQAYVRPPRRGDAARPVRELAGFEPIRLEAGETREVDADLEERVVGRYDDEGGWTVDPGMYAVEVGRSAGDVRTTSTIAI